MNFDPKMWTDKDLDKLIQLWIEFESVARACKAVNSKIKDASIKNDSLKKEIQASTDRCNEITKQSSSISIDSAGEIVQLSKNIKEVRKQEDAIEQEIATYRDELLDLITKKESIMNQINTLNSNVQQRVLSKNANITGLVKIDEIPSINSKDSISVKFPKNAIISTKRTAVVILKSSFNSSLFNSININEELITKINESGLVINTDNISEENLNSRRELEQRRKNYDASIEASNLAEQTDKELIDDNNAIKMNFITESKEENKEKDVLENNKESDVQKLNIMEPSNGANNVPASNLEESKEDVLKNNTESDVQKLNIMEPSNSADNMPAPNLEESKEEDVIDLEINTPDSLKQPEEEKIPMEDKNNIVNFSDKVVPIKPLEKEEPTNTDGVEKMSIVVPKPSKKESSPSHLGEKVNVKKGIIANAKPERISTIMSVYSKKYKGKGITSNENDSMPGFSVNSQLESVQKFLLYDKKELASSKANNAEGVSNIFGTSNDEVQPLKLSM